VAKGYIWRRRVPAAYRRFGYRWLIRRQNRADWDGWGHNLKRDRTWYVGLRPTSRRSQAALGLVDINRGVFWRKRFMAERADSLMRDSYRDNSRRRWFNE